MKKLTAFMGAAAFALYLNVPLNNQSFNKPSNPGNGSPSVKAESLSVRFVKKLEVNTSESYKTLIRKSEEEGIRDMIELVFNSRLEEAWVYVPERTMWVEYGIKEDANGPVNASLLLDMALFNELASGFDNLSLYHFHPFNSARLDELVDDYMEKLKSDNPGKLKDKSFEEAIREYAKAEMGAACALPSARDLVACIRQLTEFYKVHPNGNITYRLCSAQGITECRLTEKGIAHFLSFSHDELKPYAEGKINTIRDSLFNSKLEQKYKMDPDHRIKELAAIVTDEFMTESFIAYHDYWFTNAKTPESKK